jgi:hypothetical protein
MASFRGRHINRVVREDTYYSKTKTQEETLDYTRELVRTLLDSINRCSNLADHRADLNLFFESKDLLDTAAKFLAEEKEQSLNE